MKLFCPSRLGRRVSSFWSWKRSRNSRTAVALGGTIAQTPCQAVVPSQQMHVFGAFPADGLEQGNAFDELGLGKAALAFAQGQIGTDQSGQAQSAVNVRNAQETGVRAGRLAQRPLIQDEGRLVQQRQTRRHGNDLYEPYRTLSTKNLHSTALFMEIQELGEDQGRIDPPGRSTGARACSRFWTAGNPSLALRLASTPSQLQARRRQSSTSRPGPDAGEENGGQKTREPGLVKYES